MTAGDHLSDSQFIDLYHHTSTEAAEEIHRTRSFKSNNGQGYYRRPDAFFTTHKGSEYASAFGPAVVHIRYPATGVKTLDDEFPSGEQHYAIPTDMARRYIVKPED